MSAPEPLLWLSESRGIYIPRDFAKSFVDRARSVAHVSAKDWAIIEAGPDHEHYWDAWTEVCDRAKVTDDKGVQYYIYQDGDCWLVPVGTSFGEE